MRLLLEVKCYLIDGKPYHRIHFSKKQSNMMGLQKGDKILVDVIEIQRTDLNPTYHTIKLDEIPEVKE
ncbi:hypothetical protein ES702_04496 [subsurface metagenome]